jgi:aquaporin Z
MKKYLAEFVGTLTLVLFGCGAAVVAGPQVGVLGIAFAFGLALIMMAYGIGPISGCHINPAVSLGAFSAGRMTVNDLIGYVVAQFAGAAAGAAILAAIMAAKAGGYDPAVSGLGQNGWGADFLGGYTMNAAIIFEFVATFLFVVTILGSTQTGAPGAMAGLAIGLALTVIHIVGIQITGTSVNPARSFGPALLVGGEAMQQLWLFLAVPAAGGIAAGLLFRFKTLSAD